MRLTTIKRGFTLIELLVVITIIGILATGATAVYTSQIQKARDSTRITSVEALKSSVEQVYQDNSEYPHESTFYTEVSVYLETFPSDPKHAQPCNNNGSATNDVDCGIAYIASADDNGILYGDYELSTAFENSGNVNARAETDAGTDDLRLEIGIDLDGNITTIAADDITLGAGACQLDGTDPADGSIVIINGNPTTAGNECG